MFTRLRLRLALDLIPNDWAIVPYDPTHAMERAYFTAPMPEFKVNASGRTRRRNNKAKMVSRWQAMVAAGEAAAFRKGWVPRD